MTENNEPDKKDKGESKNEENQKPDQKPPKQKKPRSPAQIEAAKKNIQKAIAKIRKPEESKSILKDDSPNPKPPKKKKPETKKEDDNKWSGRFRFHL